MLIEIELNDESSFVRSTAVGKITDEKVLIDIAKNDEIDYLRREAVKKVSRKELLIDSNYPKIRIEAVKSISDECTLMKIAKKR